MQVSLNLFACNLRLLFEIPNEWTDFFQVLSKSDKRRKFLM